MITLNCWLGSYLLCFSFFIVWFWTSKLNEINNFCHNSNLTVKKWEDLIQKQPPELFYKKAVAKNFAKFTGTYLYWSLFFNNVAGLRPPALLKRLQLIVIDTVPLTVLFCNYPLLCHCPLLKDIILNTKCLLFWCD